MATKISGTLGVDRVQDDTLVVDDAKSGQAVGFNRMQLFAAKETTSGTSVDFSPADGTGIPSWAERITLTGVGISISGTSPFLVQGGVSSGVDTTGYASGYSLDNTSILSGNSATGLRLEPGAPAATALYTISAVLTKLSGNTGALDGKVYRTDSTGGGAGLGSKTFSGVLDRIRLTTVNGTGTFYAGSVSILVEGYE